MTGYTSVLNRTQFIVVMLAAVLYEPVRAAQSPDSSLQSAARILLNIKVKRDASHRVPQIARRSLRDMKDGLEREALATLTAASGSTSVDELQRAFELRLREDGITMLPQKAEYGPEDPDNIYGSVSELKLAPLPSHPEWVSLFAEITIPCGRDGMLVLFKRDAGTWRAALRIRVDDYTVISDALGWLLYRISPWDAHGNFFVVTSSVNPWCTSNWQEIRFQAVRVGENPAHPRVIYRNKSIIYLGVDEPIALTANTTGFNLQFEGEHPLSTDLQTFDRIFNMQVEGDSVRRLAPISDNPGSFFTEWLSLDWKDAAERADPPLREALRRWYTQFNRAYHSSSSKFYSEREQLAEMRRCPNQQFMLQLDGTRSTHYVTLKPLADGDFRITGFSTHNNPNCVETLALDNDDWKTGAAIHH